jgi:hypothetical protein
LGRIEDSNTIVRTGGIFQQGSTPYFKGKTPVQVLVLSRDLKLKVWFFSKKREDF